MEYTKEELNYFRLWYIINLIAKALRQVFKQEWDSLHKVKLGEWEDTAQNGQDFYNNETKKSRKKNARYLLTIKKGKTEEWDCTCLFFVLLFSSSISSRISAAIKTGVEDLRQVRNDIAHISEPTVTETEFQSYVGRVLKAFISLGLPISDLETVKNQTSFPTAEVNRLTLLAANLRAELQTAKHENLTLTSGLKKATVRIRRKRKQVQCLTQELNLKVEPFCQLTSHPPHAIIPRRREVAKVMEKMKELEDGSNRAVSTIFLSGMPGCGKTQIASQIGEQFFTVKSDESKGLTFVATLNAESLETLAHSYISLAKQLGVTEYSLSSLATVALESAEKTIRHLQPLIRPKTKLFDRWLMIADNVEDLPLIRRSLPQTGSKEWGLGQVLITTQDTSAIPTSAPHTYHESLSVGMQLDDALQLLKLVSQIIFTAPNQVEEVVEVHESQPLALAGAALYVNTIVNHGSPNYTWKNYLEALSRGERESTEEPLAKESAAYPKTTTTAIKMALKKFSKKEDVLRETFLLFSLIGPDPLPVEVLEYFVSTRTSGYTEELIRAKIIKSSLITCLFNDDRTPGYLRVNKTVHQILKKTPTSSLRERIQSIPDVVGALHSQTESERGNLFQSEQVCDKLRKVTAHSKCLHNFVTDTFPVKSTLVKELTSFNALHAIVLWLLGTAVVCCDLGNPSDANLFSTSACELAQYCGTSRDCRLLRANAFIVNGRALMMSCHHKLSIKDYARAIEIYTEIDGEEHPKLTKAYNDLGNIHRIAGNHHAAKECFEESTKIMKKSYFEENTADVFQKMGNLLHDLGKYTKGKDYYENSLNISKSIHGEKHPYVAKCYDNLGVASVELGKYIEAKEYLEKALVVRKEVFGERHADIATSYCHLGIFHRKLGNFITAIDYYERARFIMEKIYHPEHTDLVAVFDNFGTVYSDLGKYSEAEEYYMKALIIRRKIHRDEHADMATSYNNLGTVYNKLGKNNEAKKFHEKALIVRRRIYGEEHSHVASSYNNLGIVHSDLGKFNEAKEHYEKALIVMKKVYDEGHADVASNYCNLGTVYSEVGRYREAKEYHEKALTIRKKILSEEHPHVAASYNNLGIVNSHFGKHIEAQEYFERALTIRKNIYDEKHPDVAESYNNLGVVYHHRAKYDEARECYEKALVIRKGIYDEEHADVAASYNNLGVTYFKLGKYNEAKKYQEKALVITSKIYKENAPRSSKGKVLREKVLIMTKKICDKGHELKAAIYHNLGIVCSQLGNNLEARKYFKKALVFMKKIYDAGHRLVALIYHNLGIVCSRLGNYIQARKYFKKALVIMRKICPKGHSDIATSSLNFESIDRRLRSIMKEKNAKRKH